MTRLDWSSLDGGLISSLHLLLCFSRALLMINCHKNNHKRSEDAGPFVILFIIQILTGGGALLELEMDYRLICVLQERKCFSAKKKKRNEI